MSASGEAVWYCRHSGPGTFEETARRVSHAELAVAQLLAREGHHVKSLPEARGPGRTADFTACGVLVETKSFRALSERGGRPPSPEQVANKMLDARAQGTVFVAWAGESGLSEQAARSGYVMFCQQAMSEGLGRLRAVRVVGEGFDLRFDPVADLRASWQARRLARAGWRPSRAVGVPSRAVGVPSRAAVSAARGQGGRRAGAGSVQLERAQQGQRRPKAPRRAQVPELGAARAGSPRL